MKTLSAVLLSAALLCAGASQASAQTNNAGRALTASNNLKLSGDTQRCVQSRTVVKEFIVPYAGLVRVRLFLKSDGSTGSAQAEINSSIHSCTSTNSSTTYQAKVCNLRVQEGDAVKVLLTGPFNPSTFTNGTGCIRLVRIYYDVINASGVGHVINP